MASSGSNRKRKRLSLSLQERNDDNDTEQNKMNTSNTEPGIKTDNFMQACLKMSLDGYQDFKKRFLLIGSPECINNMCSHSERDVNIQKISLSAEHNFKTEYKNKTWHEAVEICLMCITSTQYLSASILKDIVEIIMNAHEDLDTGYNIHYLLIKCQHTLMMHFNIHPPCVTKSVRDCYRTFLTSPMERKELSNRKEYLSDEGIVSHCFSRLRYEISEESSDGTLIEKQEIPSEIEGVKRLHWKKENLELFELLTRTERIERCMFVLESIIYLLQNDLALSQYRRINSNGHTRSQLPLLKYLLWPHNILTIGFITPLCRKIMEVFVYCIHLQYPERHIKIMTLWVNAVIQMFYIYGTQSNNDYPNLNMNRYGPSFAREFYKIISRKQSAEICLLRIQHQVFENMQFTDLQLIQDDRELDGLNLHIVSGDPIHAIDIFVLALPYASQLRILEKIKPNFMQYLVGMNHIQTLLSTPQGDILHIIIWSVNNMSWDDYGVGERESTSCRKTRLKPNRLLDYLYKKCKCFNGVIVEKAYPKLVFIENEEKIEQSYVIDALFLTFVAYLETYSIKSFNQILDSFNESNNYCDSTSYKSHTVSKHFVKQYRSIIKSLQELFVMCKEKEGDQPSKKILDLINIYFS